MSNNLEIAKQYLAALEQGVDCHKLAEFFSTNVVQEEFPNRLVPSGAKRDLAAILDGYERGKKVMSRQQYELKNALASENFVALEVLKKNSQRSFSCPTSWGAKIGRWRFLAKAIPPRV